MKAAAPLRLGVVIPVRDGRATLLHTLPAVLRAGRQAQDGAPVDGDGVTFVGVVLVDDGSVDGTAQLAETIADDLALAPVRVVPSGGTGLGPARARNVGTEQLDCDVVVFVDADVEVHPDALSLLAQALRDDARTAVYGSYDDRPDHTGFASRYMNLRHHYGHRQPSEDAATFWAGLGAVRRQAFFDVGGFDAAAYPFPSIEDIEFGVRLRLAGGRIARRPDIQGTHLKRWTLGDVVATDVRRRALPWARLARRHPTAFGDLNLRTTEQLRAMLAGVFALTVVGTLCGVVPFVMLLAVLGGVLLAHARFAALLARTGGPSFALAALLFHQVHYLYAGATWVFARLSSRTDAGSEAVGSD